MSVDNEKHGCEELICKGNYIIIQRQQYFKLHQLSDMCVSLGKDKVDLNPILGKPFWSVFKMVLKKGSSREYILEVTKKVESLSEAIMRKVPSGSDNRNISDDGRSQKLTTDEIVSMRNSGLSTKNIVGKLVENSKTFASKTEYSQQKYLKKKEKKYAEYIIIRKPTLRLLSEIFYNRNQGQVHGLRYDTLSQIISAANIQSNGVYVLYENSTQAILGATILHYLSDAGVLINICLGNQPAKQAILAMNYGISKLKNCLSVKASTFLSCLDPENSSMVEGRSDIAAADRIKENSEREGDDRIDVCKETSASKTTKRKQEVNDDLPKKKPKWADELEDACQIIKSRKADGLIIACKEFPLPLIYRVMPYINPSRPLIIYSPFREPLIEMYVELKKRKDVVGLHLSETFLRNIQVLPNRTHPEVLMSTSGGHVLTGLIVNK